MDFKIDMSSNMQMDLITFQKMSFIFNAVDAGWSVKKRDDKYIFAKKHEGKKEVYLETYLPKFIESNLHK
jgi:hypothetical protein